MLSSTRDKLIAVLESETNLSFKMIDQSQPLRNQIALDSMQFITIIARLEHEFNTTIPLSIMSVVTFDDFVSELTKIFDNK